MGFCTCSMKTLLFLFNTICAIVGLVIIAMGVYAYVQENGYNHFSSNVSTLVIVLISVGAVTFIISFLGCFGTIRDDSCWIQTYAVLLTIILLTQIVIAGVLFYFRGTVNEDLKQSLEPIFSEYSKNSKTIDTIQTNLHCCGYSGPASYGFSQLPQSCCRNDSVKCTMDEAYPVGCQAAMQATIKSAALQVAITAIIVAIVEFICIVFAYCVASSIRREQRNGYSY